MTAAIDARHKEAVKRLEDKRLHQIEVAKKKVAEREAAEKAIAEVGEAFKKLASNVGKEPHELARLLARHFPAPARPKRVVKAASGAEGAEATRERHKRTVITDEIEDAVKKLAQAGKKAPTIAKELDISNPTTYAIMRKVCPEFLPENTGTAKSAPASAKGGSAGGGSPGGKVASAPVEDPVF